MNDWFYFCWEGDVEGMDILLWLSLLVLFFVSLLFFVVLVLNFNLYLISLSGYVDGGDMYLY